MPAGPTKTARPSKCSWMDQSGLDTTPVGELGSSAEGIRNSLWFSQHLLVLIDSTSFRSVSVARPVHRFSI